MKNAIKYHTQKDLINHFFLFLFTKNRGRFFKGLPDIQEQNKIYIWNQHSFISSLNYFHLNFQGGLNWLEEFPLYGQMSMFPKTKKSKKCIIAVFFAYGQ